MKYTGQTFLQKIHDVTKKMCIITFLLGYKNREKYKTMLQKILGTTINYYVNIATSRPDIC
jgi:hypothetical protein